MLEQRFLSIFIFKYFRNLQVFFFYQQVYYISHYFVIQYNGSQIIAIYAI